MDTTATPNDAAEHDAGKAPTTWRSRLSYVGPGLVIAATGVGAGDMVSSLSAGAGFGTVLIWAIIIGAVLKYVLTEGLGRWYMATGTTILAGWRSLGLWASLYFGIYLLIVSFVFGAAVVSACALATTAMFPDVMPLWAWAALHGIAGFLIVGIGHYRLFERVMEIFIGIMFVTVVGLACLLAPASALGDMALSAIVPRIPEGGFLNVLAIIGGVGGTFTLAAYPYWVREKGWRRPDWIPTMRLDLTVGYLITGLFMVSMLVVGSELLHGTGASIEGDSGLVALAEPIAERFGALASWLFLIGFWAAAASSVLGTWNGAAYLFADFIRTLQPDGDARAEEYLSEKGFWFRAFLVWITFPPMILLTLGKPVYLVIIYAALGAFFMPFMAVTLLWLLNRRVPAPYRNGIVTNAFLAICVVLFIGIGLSEILGG